MPPARGYEGIREAIGEWLYADGVQPDESDVAEGSRELARVIKLARITCVHGTGGVEQQSHWNAGLHLEYFQEQFFKAQIGAPVYGAEVVALMEMAVFEKLLARAWKSRDVVAADQPRK